MNDAVPNPVLTDRFAQAFAFASVVHAGQARKGSAIPYLSHLRRFVPASGEDCEKIIARRIL